MTWRFGIAHAGIRQGLRAFSSIRSIFPEIARLWIGLWSPIKTLIQFWWTHCRVLRTYLKDCSVMRRARLGNASLHNYPTSRLHLAASHHGTGSSALTNIEISDSHMLQTAVKPNFQPAEPRGDGRKLRGGVSPKCAPWGCISWRLDSFLEAWTLLLGFSFALILSPRSSKYILSHFQLISYFVLSFTLLRSHRSNHYEDHVSKTKLSLQPYFTKRKW